MRIAWLFSLAVLFCLSGSLHANPPVASYIFPAGGQRGTTVPVRVGGLFLHDECDFEVGGGLKASRTLRPAPRLWFEGPLLPLPESQQQQDYPAEMAGTVILPRDAPLGPVRGRVFTAQGGAGGLVFMVGELPEVVEHEVDGEPIPQAVSLPVTANGRIFPHEDIDLWEFEARAGRTVTAFVHARSLNSPLLPQLDILDAAGHVVASRMPHPIVGTDGSIKFTARADGKYRVRITDARTLGGQSYVYRLTITTAEVPEYHFPLRMKPDGLRDVLEAKDVIAAPVALNGRIGQPGHIDHWKLELKKGGKYTLALHARREDSPLCGVVAVVDAAGKELARVENTDASLDPAPLNFSPTTNGTYTIQVSERFRGRGGPNFVYRLCITEGDAKGEQGFRLKLEPDARSAPSPDAITVVRGTKVNVNVAVERQGGFTGPIELAPGTLPVGVTVSPVKVPANQSRATVAIQADATAAIGTVPFSLTGTAVIDGKQVQQRAVVPATRDLPEEAAATLTIGLAAPFKIIDQYVMTSAPRGEVYRRKFKLDRGGFEGPIRIELADKQARHLQGVSGPTLVIPPGQTEFDYPAFLPPWMELGRTCRVCVMATARVKDAATGREHTVSFSSTEQNQQMIVVVGPGRLDLDVDRTSLSAAGGKVAIKVKVTRGKGLHGPARVEVVQPEHWKGLRSAPIAIGADQESGELVLLFDKDHGPFNAPLVLRATIETKETPVTAEARVEIVP
jgi:hypothetical protein